jgi:hypothetical protein
MRADDQPRKQALGMEHPIQYLEPVFKFLDHCVREYGDYFFIALLYACMIFLAWFLVRPRRRNEQ